MLASLSHADECITVSSLSSLQSGLSKNEACIASLSPQGKQDIKELLISPSSTPTSAYVSPLILQDSSSLFSHKKSVIGFRQLVSERDYLANRAEAWGKKVLDFSLSEPPSPSAHHSIIDVDKIDALLNRHRTSLDWRYEVYGEDGLNNRCGFTPESVRECFKQRLSEHDRMMRETSSEGDQDEPKPQRPYKEKNVQISPQKRKRRASEDLPASQDVSVKKRRFTQSIATSNSESLLENAREDKDQGDALFFEKRDSGGNIRTYLKRQFNKVTLDLKSKESTGMNSKSIWFDKRRPRGDKLGSFSRRSWWRRILSEP